MYWLHLILLTKALSEGQSLSGIKDKLSIIIMRIWRTFQISFSLVINYAICLNTFNEETTSKQYTLVIDVTIVLRVMFIKEDLRTNKEVVVDKLCKGMFSQQCCRYKAKKMWRSMFTKNPLYKNLSAVMVLSSNAWYKISFEVRYENNYGKLHHV